MIRLLLPNDAPAWAVNFARSIERAFRDQRLEEYDSAALPAAERGKQIFVADIPAVAFSDGTHWFRTDTGATL